MDRVTLGKTGITVCRNGFGALPIQRIGKEDAAYLVRKAYENGVNFFDTARAYTDSEEKLGYATSSFRDKIYIATKTAAKNGEDLKKDLELKNRLQNKNYSSPSLEKQLICVSISSPYTVDELKENVTLRKLSFMLKTIDAKNYYYA